MSARDQAMKPRDRVLHLGSNRLGTLCPTIYLLLADGDDDLSVIFDDKPGLPSTLDCHGGRQAFVVIGEENAVADLKECGAGQGDKCCIYLVVGSAGPECARMGSLRYVLQFRTMAAKRDPKLPYPGCKGET